MVGTDANAHHTKRGSKDISNRGKSLCAFILQNIIQIANRGPTSENVLDMKHFKDYKTVIDDWQVLTQPSFSDHFYISFLFNYTIRNVIVFRNPRTRDWAKYSSLLAQEQLLF